MTLGVFVRTQLELFDRIIDRAVVADTHTVQIVLFDNADIYAVKLTVLGKAVFDRVARYFLYDQRQKILALSIAIYPGRVFMAFIAGRPSETPIRYPVAFGSSDAALPDAPSRAANGEASGRINSITIVASPTDNIQESEKTD